MNDLIIIVSPTYPGTPLRQGASGSEVARMQKYLNAIRTLKYTGLNFLTVDGNFGSGTKTTVQQYQGYARLPIDGTIGQNTWNSIVTDYNTLVGGSADTYPGIPLKNGMRGQDVTHMQRYLNTIALIYTAINTQTVDGNFGTNMSNAVKLFQRQFSLDIDGAIGTVTWNAIVGVYNALKSGNKPKVTTKYPGYALSQGASGDAVRCVQSYLNATAKGRWDTVVIDGNFGAKTRNAVIAFQANYALKPDGIVGMATWQSLITQFNM